MVSLAMYSRGCVEFLLVVQGFVRLILNNEGMTYG
jgi:hypothetical protein